MKEQTFPGWTKVFETFEFMQAEIIESKLRNEGIEFRTLNKADIGYTMEVGNASLGREAVGLPIRIFVEDEKAGQVKKLLEEDFNKLFDDPDSEFISQ